MSFFLIMPIAILQLSQVFMLYAIYLAIVENGSD